MRRKLGRTQDLCSTPFKHFKLGRLNNTFYIEYSTEFTLMSSPESPLVKSNAKVPSFIGANQDAHSTRLSVGAAFARDLDASSALLNASGIASVRHCTQSEAQGSYCGWFRRDNSCKPQCISNDPCEMVKTPVYSVQRLGNPASACMITPWIR